MGIFDFLFPKKETNSSKLALDGEVLIRQSKYKEALRKFNLAIELEPENDMFYASRSNAKKGLQDYKGALSDIEKAISLNQRVTAYQDAKNILEQLMK